MRILNYHGVVDRSADRTHYSRLFTDVRDFEAQLELLTRVARPVSLADIEHALVEREPLPPGAVHVTFDDGYRNNLVAAEILERHRVPWSLFVVVDAVLDGYEPWFLRLHDAVRVSTHVRLADGTLMDLTTDKDKRRFAKLAKAEIMAVRGADQDGAVASLLALSGMEVPSETAWPLLSPAELTELSVAGVEIGNHSARHRNLSTCAPGDLHTEVELSRTRLEQHLGSAVRAFAYPDGRHNERVHRAVSSGHTLGLATWTVRDPLRPMALRRYEPLDDADLGTLLDKPEPQYGIRWARWTLPWRARELALRVRPARRRLVTA